ncbi:hypothetical protein GCM10010346_62270 [Streptomyces chryseus]|uniref:Uncharacterized protein n=1 Tax=Streptomyces chryseus TaxID=68186 RepID=A0ABQ3ECB2_9ACTN|nr:hypothetical protein GCM10010346_62270 [Streptomyces chryseus]
MVQAACRGRWIVNGPCPADPGAIVGVISDQKTVRDVPPGPPDTVATTGSHPGPVADPARESLAFS